MQQIRRNGEKKERSKGISCVHGIAQVEKRGYRKNYKSLKMVYIMRKLTGMLNVQPNVH